ncbi:choline dehydrogenase, mitochondrial-like isoform X2 [Dermacentor andersoni]|uniref:choline dehydrogenase, mitochondrial-like isoform X2 n=1 Tax=Dermacentor andersoni TaxID=34620 RepID=UPI002416F8C7|nr:alcohol dehydrogenase [acceptor]-like isoform X2 [Dermacentor andersoni]
MLLSTAWNTVAYIFGIFANGFQDVFHFLICVVYTINLINLPTDLDVDEQRLLDKYDYVIVGGGSAGCVLANRLSADPSKMVLLIEAGGMEKPLAQIPLFAPLLIGSSFDWKYHPQPQEHACLSMEDRRCRLARGMALGGSSAINFMLYVRGNRRDYDIWRDEFGAHGWSYRDVFPHFKNIETARLPDQEPFYRGTHGEIPVEYASTQTRLSKAFLGACEENGYPVIDYNGRSQAGCSRLQFNTRHGQRYSASKSFITPILHRRNLHISLWSRATKVIFENQHAVGVRFLKGPRMHTVRASREVVIAAGAIGSPQLLLLSGVGPWFDLEQLKIPVIADLPVGRNLQDHMHVEGVSGTLRHRDGINLFWSSTVDYNNNCSGVKIALRLIKSRAMRAIKAKPWDIPLEACASEGPTWSNEYLACFVRHMAHTTWHLCCTCPMGSDNRAVVDPRLRVYGLKNLRVVDASVMPTIVTGNLNAPVMMIADKAAAMILQDN